MQKHTNHTHIIRIILMFIFAKERKYDTASNMHALTQTHTHSSQPLKLVLVSRGICIRVYFSVCLLFVQHILNNDILFICDFVFGWYGVKDIISAIFLCLPICACERVWLCSRLAIQPQTPWRLFMLLIPFSSHLLILLILLSLLLYPLPPLNTLSFPHFSPAATCSHSDPLCCRHTHTHTCMQTRARIYTDVVRGSLYRAYRHGCWLICSLLGSKTETALFAVHIHTTSIVHMLILIRTDLKGLYIYRTIWSHTHIHTVGPEPITYFLWFGFGKKAAGTFCWIMAALISSLSISPSLFSLHPSRSLSLSPSLFLRMVLVFISLLLGACKLPKLFVRSVFKNCVCVCISPCLHASETFTSCLKEILWMRLIKKEWGNGSKKKIKRGKLCEVFHISPASRSGCETSQFTNLTSLWGIRSFFLSLVSPSPPSAFSQISFCKNGEMPHECVWKNEKHMASLEKLNHLPTERKCWL